MVCLMGVMWYTYCIIWFFTLACSYYQSAWWLLMTWCLLAPDHQQPSWWRMISVYQECQAESLIPGTHDHRKITYSCQYIPSEMCSERDSPLKRLYRRTHVKLTRLAGFGQLVWAAGCELSLALVHAQRPAWPGETSETMLRVVPPRITRPPDHTRVNWPVDASASGSAQVGSGGRHRWAARVQVGREPARQKAREPSHYTSLIPLTWKPPTHLVMWINCTCIIWIPSLASTVSMGVLGSVQGGVGLTHWGQVTNYVMACCLDSTKPLSEPMVEYC